MVRHNGKFPHLKRFRPPVLPYRSCSAFLPVTANPHIKPELVDGANVTTLTRTAGGQTRRTCTWEAAGQNSSTGLLTILSNDFKQQRNNPAIGNCCLLSAYYAA
jgi:hypothetical protein